MAKAVKEFERRCECNAWKTRTKYQYGPLQLFTKPVEPNVTWHMDFIGSCCAVESLGALVGQEWMKREEKRLVEIGAIKRVNKVTHVSRVFLVPKPGLDSAGRRKFRKVRTLGRRSRAEVGSADKRRPKQSPRETF
jgi:hypothetical protein